MREVSQDEVVAALAHVGVRPGDGLLIHSAIQFLGKPLGGVSMYLQALEEALDCELRNLNSGSSTLAFPAFNFAFARGEAFDPQNTPSEGMGVLSEYARKFPGALRTSHPMQSLALIGRYANDLAKRDTPSAFDSGSAFERMLELDFKLLLLGANIQAVSMLHYCEQRACVPYRYWKEFTGEYLTPKGWETRTYRMFVRDLEIDPRIELFPVQALLEQRDQWQSVTLNYGKISLCRLADFVAGVDEFLAKDPWSLVVNRPQP